jgi:hypothetical protein
MLDLQPSVNHTFAWCTLSFRDHQPPDLDLTHSGFNSLLKKKRNLVKWPEVKASMNGLPKVLHQASMEALVRAFETLICLLMTATT